MAFTYTYVPNGNLESGKPGRAVDMRAIRDMAPAIAEGADDAPRMALAAMGAWFLTPGAPGTHTLARRASGGDLSFGATVAGSALTPTSVAYSVKANSITLTGTLSGGSALSGTWQCVGHLDAEAASGVDESGNSVTLGGATLFQRIL